MSVSNWGSRVRPLTDLLFDVSADNDATNRLNAKEFSMFDHLLVIAPGTLTGTITLAALIDYSMDETADASWATVQTSPGTDLAFAAGKAVVFDVPPAVMLRLESSGTEAADRRFRVYGIQQYR